MTGTLATRKPLTGYHLKLIALITMFIDHITVVLVPSGTVYLVLRGIGRISFPIYVFLIAEGCRYTSDRFKYAMRLGAFALISEIPYDLALYPAVLEQTGWGWNFTWRTNVFYTLFFAVAIIHIYETLRRQSRGRQLLGIGCEAAFFAIVILVALYVESPLSIRVMMVVSTVYVLAVLLLCRWMEKHPGKSAKPGWLANVLAVAALIVPVLMAQELGSSYGIFGILVIFLVYLAKDRKWQCIFLSLWMLHEYVWSTVAAALQGGAVNMVSAISWPGFALLSAALIYFAYNGQRGRKAKWGFYAAYPAHLAILAAIRALLKV